MEPRADVIDKAQSLQRAITFFSTMDVGKAAYDAVSQLRDELRTLISVMTPQEIAEAYNNERPDQDDPDSRDLDPHHFGSGHAYD